MVRVPLTIDYLTLSEVLKQQVYSGPGGRAELWSGSDPCRYLVAENPVFSRAGETAVKLETVAQLSVGMRVGDTCVSPISWKGIIEAEARPYVAPGMMLRFHVTDLNLYNERHQKTLIAGHGFDLIKRYFIPRLEGFGFDLNPATRQLIALAEEAAPPNVAERVRTALATLHAEPAIGVSNKGVRATLALTLPLTATPVPSAVATPAPLTPAEVAAFEKTLDQWDAFMVFAIKQLGETKHDPVLRDQLFNLLLDSRHRLVEALENPISRGPDPVRILFLNEWHRLGDIIHDAASRGSLGNRSLEFLSFISAGDALFALDEAAPALGMRISAADLRRLAKIMAPNVKTDPLAFGFGEDPELRRMFGFNEKPLREEPGVSSGTGTASPTASTPSPTVPSRTPTSHAIPTPSPMPTRVTPTPPPHATPTVSPASPHGALGSPAPSPAPTTSWLDLPLHLLSPASACAGERDARASRNSGSRHLRALGSKLRRTIVDNNNAREYREHMRELLTLTARRTFSGEQVPANYREMYARLVKSVAWQESCWRQFVLKKGRVTWLESSSGDIGLMQVNKRVWRGFYDIHLLEWDVVYNAGAGAEILAHLLADISTSHGSANPGHADELARSTYAAYNGGPSRYSRWRGRESRVERLVDRAFWDKYRAVSRGQTIDVLSCAAEWGKAPGH